MEIKEKVARKTGGYLNKLREIAKQDTTRINERLKGEYTLYSGDPSLEWATGGYLRNGCNLFWGPPGSGKSTLARMAAATEQKLTGGVVLIFDSEFDSNDDDEAKVERWRKEGLDPDKVVYRKSNRIDTLFEGITELEADIKAGENISAIIVDSWGGIQSENAIKKIEKGEIAAASVVDRGNAKLITPMIQTFLRIAGENGIPVFFVQHCIVNQEEYGPKYILVGGEKLKFLVGFNLYLEPISAKDARLGEGDVQLEKSDDESIVVGAKIRARCGKSRRVTSGRKVEFWFNYNDCHFAKPAESLFNLAKNLGVIGNPSTPELDKAGNIKLDSDGKPIVKVSTSSWQYPATGTTSTRWHGAPKTIEALEKNKELFDKVLADCTASKSTNAAGSVEFGDDSAKRKAK